MKEKTINQAIFRNLIKYLDVCLALVIQFYTKNHRDMLQ
jgi:hypothetical protein